MYALKFAPIYKAKVWGGRRLELLGRDLPYGPIGESWELVDVAETTASGGGGGAAHSVVSNGPRYEVARCVTCCVFIKNHFLALPGPGGMVVFRCWSSCWMRTSTCRYKCIPAQHTQRST